MKLSHSTRRGFLASSAALALPALAARPNLRFGLATYEWGQDWDIPTILANLAKAKVHGVELKTLIKYGNGREARYPHGVELELSPAARREVKKRFADSPVDLISLATSEHFPWPDEAQNKEAIELVKQYLQLSHDVGSEHVRVLPNGWLKNEPHQKTLDMIADQLNAVAKTASDLGQLVDLEAHSAPGGLPDMKYVLDRVPHKCVGVRLNSELRNTENPAWPEQFEMVKNRLATTMHVHSLKDPKYPYQTVINTLYKAGWNGWALLEVSEKVPDRVAGLAEQRELFEAMVQKAKS